MIDAAGALDQYEALRCEALEVAPWGPRGHGLALVITRGLPAWLAALPALAPPRRERAHAAQPAEPAAAYWPAARGELTTILAGMVLACTHPKEERA